MMKFLARRVVTAVPLLFFVSFAMFLLIALTPGDPAYRLAGENATPEQVEQVRKALRLDDPLLVRYATWLTNAVRGDLGKSMSTTEPVTGMILQRIPVTLSLAGMAL